MSGKKSNKNGASKKPAPKKPKKQNKKPVTAKPATGKTKKLSEFRYPKRKPNDNGPLHPRYIYKGEGDDFFGLEITHDRSGANRSKTKPLIENPNPKDAEKARIKKKAERKSKKDFGERLKGWGFRNKKDRETVQEIIAKNNQKPPKKI